jgi:hypothetical protein
MAQLENCYYCGKPGTFPDNQCEECYDKQDAARTNRGGDEDDEDEEELMGYEGGSCTRCGLSLDEGYCPNLRCPFSHTYQDEMIEDWTYPDDDERDYIASLRGPIED